MNSGTWVSDKEYNNALSVLPLVSIDLIIKNSKNEYLLGFRNTPPANNSWFVLGGRIRKMEKFNDAFRRISKMEIGQTLEINNSKLIGIFEHMYDDSVASSEIGTHYVSIAMEIEIEENDGLEILGKQHDQYKWFNIKELIKDDKVHIKTKEFFIEEVGIRLQ